MRHTSLALIAALSLTAAARALDLTPQFADVDADGLVMKLPYFQDGPKRVFIKPPAGWKIDGNSERANLSSEAAPHSTVTFTLSAKPVLPKSEAERKTLREAMLTLPGKEAANVMLEADTLDPLPLNGWKTIEFRVSYDLADKRFQKSVLLVKLNAIEELRVTVTGPAQEFAKAAGAAMMCLRTWHKQ